MNGDAALNAPVGTVTFHPDKSKGNSSTELPQGELTPQGTYELYTKGKKGAPAGWYKVVVVASEAAPKEATDDVSPPKLFVLTKYTALETTPLSIEVKEGGDFTLKLDPMQAPRKKPGS